ncbi:hypothetical protein ASPACDRAFT_1889517 [Aspergillus aculeatus ATCC 16872]|uniref:chitinase n=1 Tax=Aspergillus aculeatus (strain ATCC 16872 / CBS 172.66 / WB 5094) TaxID=690307 RepID=A0A1L9WPZ2_ASPA1|nr:uncharacterized protein ASPACDRAFT_1889517 [Aspergillus aculeatus ATCC 16872]OJJ98253.1 hypothetical protein ASPACDRAFT_1889517 [Aspergillus aculeatus ATCC 16872]
MEASQIIDSLDDVQAYVASNPAKASIFGYSDKVVVGIYMGGRFEASTTAATVVEQMTSYLATQGSFEQMALQYCGSTANYMVGLAISTQADLPAVQQLVKTWSDGNCISGFDSETEVQTTLMLQNKTSSSPNTVVSRSVPRSGLGSRADTCSTVQVVSGDTCTTLVTECGITATEFYEYNTASDLCSTLAVGHIQQRNMLHISGRIRRYLLLDRRVYSLTTDKINSYNNNTWGWLGCDDLQAGENICLSDGDPPFPAPVANAVCGPQVAGTTANGTSYDKWAELNPCPLNACCDVWGECGTTPDFCTITESVTGNPGTAKTGTDGCISNCGITIENNSTAPAEFFSLGYFESFNVDRTCLTMDAYMIDTDKYTHVIFGFGTINADFSISINQTEQFEQFLNLTDVKKIVSFGGWDFSTSTDTYSIFREGVTAANRATLAKNLGDFVSKYSLDGIDIDWEYPGEPDIPGIPAGSSEDGTNYVAFLKEVRSIIGTSKTLSIAMPASYWYLQGFPVADINDIVDFIVYMTYDLHGQWDYGNTSADDGCADGNCLRSHVNLTETYYALSMVTKGGADTNKLMVGVSSYGRSFEMTAANCTGPECTYVGPNSGATPGRCTQTAGYIANAEINEIIATNPTVQVLFDSGSDSDIIVYNETQWVGYMTNTTKSTRTSYYKGLNMGGTTEWAIDLEAFVYAPTEFNEQVDMYFSEKVVSSLLNSSDICSFPASSESSATASKERGVAAYIDWLLEDDLQTSAYWTRQMFVSTGAGSTQCDLYPDGSCPFPTGYCSNYSSPEEYWAEYVVANFREYVNEFGTLFQFATANQTLSIADIVSDFPVKTGPAAPGLSTVLSNVGSILGIVGAGVPLLDVPEEVETDVGSSLIGAASGIFGVAGSSVSSSTTTSTETETLLDQVQQVYSWMLDGVEDTLAEIFEHGNISSWASGLRAGDYTSEIANFFDGRYMFELSEEQAKGIQSIFNQHLRAYLVGSALAAANYYILKGAYSTTDCAQKTSGTVIGDSCYTLQYPSSTGWTLTKQIMTELISSDDLTKLTGTYDVDLETLYTNSYTCQNTTGTYYGTKTPTSASDILDAASTTLPTCFFNLPVFTVEISDEPSTNNYLSSPCLVYRLNSTASTAELGVTWMPSNLAKIFVKDFCQCSQSERECLLA